MDNKHLATVNIQRIMNNATLPKRKLRTLHLFAGAGGGILADLLLGHEPIGAVEIEEYPRKVLLARQRDGILPRFPIWDDVRTFDGKRWRGHVDIVCGGFPCQDISPARTNNRTNGKQAGILGNRSGLWSSMRRIIKDVQPGACFIENSPQLRTRGLSVVLQNLAAMGYNATWGVFGVRNFGADHIRERLFIYATNSDLPQRKRGGVSGRIHQKHTNAISSDWWKNQPEMERVANGVSSGLDANWGKRLKAIGNAQSPIVAALAWRILSGE